jgi:fibronectin type III domain protein
MSRLRWSGIVVALLFAVASSAPLPAHALIRDYVLRWLPSSGVVDGYRSYFAEQGQSTQMLDLGAVTPDADGIARVTLQLDSATTYGVWVTAYNQAGESAPSNQITVPASIPASLGDADGDGVLDDLDNCRSWFNPDQSDGDGNGIGDECECGDQNGDGTVNVLDLIAINRATINPSLATPLCDTNYDGKCDVQDIVGADQKIFGRPAYCSRYPPPGP